MGMRETFDSYAYLMQDDPPPPPPEPPPPPPPDKVRRDPEQEGEKAG